jgi:hypothetical protein
VKSRDLESFKLTERVSDALGLENMKLKEKYKITLRYKFNGKKRKVSNSGGTGRAKRRVKRSNAPVRPTVAGAR